MKHVGKSLFITKKGEKKRSKQYSNQINALQLTISRRCSSKHHQCIFGSSNFVCTVRE